MANRHTHLDATTLTRARSICAFTLVEILIVVVIMGIAGALVVPQLSNAGQMTIQAAARMAIADVLYAQGEAVARQSVYKVVFDVDGNSYQLTDANDVVLRSIE